MKITLTSDMMANCMLAESALKMCQNQIFKADSANMQFASISEVSVIFTGNS